MKSFKSICHSGGETVLFAPVLGGRKIHLYKILLLECNKTPWRGVSEQITCPQEVSSILWKPKTQYRYSFHNSLPS